MKESCVRPETVKIPRVFGLKTHIELWNWQLDNELFPSCMYMLQIDTYGWNGRSLWSIHTKKVSAQIILACYRNDP